MGEQVDKNKTSKPLKFVDNEKILCYQGALLYEAKCLKSELKADGNYMHLVHYAGWNKHYDEWVSEGRCMKYTLDNLLKQNEILEKVSKDHRSKRIKLGNGVKLKNERAQSNQSKANSENNSSAVSATVLGNEESTFAVEKQNSEAITENKINLPVRQHQQQLLKQQIEDKPIIIPCVLKCLLGDDWVFVNNERMIFNLPAEVNVEQVILMYMDEAHKQYSEDEWKVVKGDLVAMKEWFNVSLGSKLLYKFERPQLGDMIDLHPDLAPCQIYGIPHFIRFFTQIEASMKKYNMKEQDRKLVRINCQNVINYISDNLSILFSLDDYFHAPAEYHRRAMT